MSTTHDIGNTPPTPPTLYEAAKLLAALRRMIPGPIPALLLDEETGTKLVVSLCDRETRKFELYTLDAADLIRPAEHVANEIATMRTARVAATQTQIDADNCPST